MAEKLRSVARKRAPIYCSFCGREEDEVECIVVGPASAAICDRCVGDAVSIIAQKTAGRRALDAAGE